MLSLSSGGLELEIWVCKLTLMHLGLARGQQLRHLGKYREDFKGPCIEVQVGFGYCEERRALGTSTRDSGPWV